VADRLECSTFVCEKRKHADGTAIYPPVIPDVRGRDILVVDDLCSSGSTLLPLAETLRRSGATELRFAVTHLLCSAERRSWLVAQGIAVICSDTARSDGISCAQLLLSGLESGRLASWA
jgi:ribose-phosphate pyrophosphokinase